MNATGAAVITWVNRERELQAVYRPADGPFSKPETVSPVRASFPDLAVAADGTAALAWDQKFTKGRAIEVAVRPPGGTFQAPIVLSTSGSSPRVAVSSNGGVAVVWETRGDAQGSLRLPGGSFTAPQSIPGSAKANAGLEVVIDDSGTATVLVNGRLDRALVKASINEAGKRFTRARRITRPGQEAEFATLALDGSGNATAIWDLFHNGAPAGVQTSYRPAGGDFTTPRRISGPHGGGVLSLAVNREGAAVAAWNGGSRSSTTIRAAFSSHGQRFGAPERISPGIVDFALVPASLAINERSRALAAWTKPTRRNLEGRGIFVSTRR
jgi:hypothetical protein